MSKYTLYLSEVEYFDKESGTFGSLSAAVAAARQHLANGVRPKAYIEWDDDLGDGRVSQNLAYVDAYEANQIILDVD